jgi:hypothetical protein
MAWRGGRRSCDCLAACDDGATSWMRASRGTIPANKRASNANQLRAWEEALMVSAGIDRLSS